jgi:DNA topoisomerase-1
MAVYLEGKDDNKESDDKETFLPPMAKGDAIPFLIHLPD